MLTYQPVESRTPFRKYLRIGLLFELLLFVLCFVPQGGGLVGQLQNLIRTLHLPMLIGVTQFGFGEGLVGAIAWTILCGVVWITLLGAVWGLLFYLVAKPVSPLLVRANVTARQKTVLTCSLGVLLGVLLVAYGVALVLQARPRPFTSSPDVESTVNANTAFALDLYHQLKAQPGNLVFAPFSISSALAMTYGGARGQTAAEMEKALHFNLPPENLHSGFGVLVRRMDALQRWGRITLVVANSIWCQQDYKFTEDFLEMIRKYYRGEACQVDFVGAPAAAAKQINQWVAHRTKEKITGAVSRDMFTAYSRLVLCNAIYFKGKWLHQFKTRDTKPAPFYVSPDKTVRVPMMYQSSRFKTAFSDDGSVHMLEMPYSGRDLSMVILLPEGGQLRFKGEWFGLAELEQKLTVQNLRAWLGKLDEATPRNTAVYFPRFTLSHAFDLAQTLQNLGMKSAFGLGADFSGMDGTTNLFVSDVIHKASIEVDEAGTEGAAATLVHVAPSMPGQFKVDHPFIFLIRDTGTGSILFLGRVVDPTQQ